MSQLEFIFISGFRNDIDNHDDDKGDRDDHGDDDGNGTNKVLVDGNPPHLIGKHSRGKSAGLEGSAGTNVS